MRLALTTILYIITISGACYLHGQNDDKTLTVSQNNAHNRDVGSWKTSAVGEAHVRKLTVTATDGALIWAGSGDTGSTWYTTYGGNSSVHVGTQNVATTSDSYTPRFAGTVQLRGSTAGSGANAYRWEAFGKYRVEELDKILVNNTDVTNGHIVVLKGTTYTFYAQTKSGLAFPENEPKWYVQGVFVATRASLEYRFESTENKVIEVKMGSSTKRVSVQVIEPLIYSIDFSGQHVQELYDVKKKPEWRHDYTEEQKEPFCIIKNQTASMVVLIVLSKALTFETPVLVQYRLSGELGNLNYFVSNNTTTPYSYSRQSLILKDEANVTSFSDLKFKNKVSMSALELEWSYSIQDCPTFYELCKSINMAFTTWNTYKCNSQYYTKTNMSYAVMKAIEHVDLPPSLILLENKETMICPNPFGGELIEDHTEEQMVRNVCMNVDGKVELNTNPHINGGRSCICSNTGYDFQMHFDLAMGNNLLDGSNSPIYIGMCCCRAKGLICVLEVLGLGDYVKGYANYETPSTRLPLPYTCTVCNGTFCFFGFGGGIYNNFQGTAYKSSNPYGIHYSPQGPHIAPYHVLIDAPSHLPGNLSRPLNTLNAFNYYRWNKDPRASSVSADHCPNTPPHNLPVLSKPGP